MPSLLLKVDFRVLLFCVQMKALSLRSCAAYFMAISFFNPSNKFYLFFLIITPSIYMLLLPNSKSGVNARPQ